MSSDARGRPLVSIRAPRTLNILSRPEEPCLKTVVLELLRDICRARLLAENAMFNPLESSDTDFFDLTPRLRVWIIYKLCCWKVEDEQAITDAIDIKVTLFSLITVVIFLAITPKFNARLWTALYVR